MLRSIKGVGDKTLAALRKLNINTVYDLINNLPKSYLDLSNVTALEQAMDGSFCLVDLEIVEKKQPIIKGRLKIFKAIAKSKESYVNLIWYNQNYVAKKLIEGKVYTFYGKLRIRDFMLEFNNPMFEEKRGISKFQGLQPIYYTKGLIHQRTYWNIVKEALNTITIESVVPTTLEKAHNIITLKEAYLSVHMPNGEEGQGKDRIMLERLIRRIAAFRLSKMRNCAREKHNFFIKFDIKKYQKILPFDLNNSQIQAVESMADILCSNQALNAILSGDVGSGKTIVAMLLALFTKENGYQTAFIAPTEILCRQHYDNLCKLCHNLNVNIAFLSAATKAKERREILQRLSVGQIDIIVGTHSLLNSQVEFSSLAFVVIDEQHRFGVAQRTCLIEKGKNANVLTLSATPIPRSLQLAHYGDIDYFTIDGRFENKTITVIVPPEKRMDMWQYLYVQCIEKKGQAFIVAPHIFDQEGVEKESVEDLCKELTKIFPKDKVRALHGKLSAEQKQDIIDAFRQNKTSVLISTTVVEVGIDVPNANHIVIMDAESFGLATLHQLRGRVGRGGGQAYCFLYTTKPDQGLVMLTQTSDGKILAEKDFELRRAGDILGLPQSGTGTLSGITIRNLAKAKQIVDNLPLDELYQELQKEIEEFSLANVSIT